MRVMDDIMMGYHYFLRDIYSCIIILRTKNNVLTTQRLDEPIRLMCAYVYYYRRLEPKSVICT